MSSGASTWSLDENAFNRIQECLNGLLGETNARSALLVDRAGQLLANVGEDLGFDPTSFASLTAADFSANDQLAKMIGEDEFASLFHQGEKESMFLADVARRVILVILFDNKTTVGMVRLKAKATVNELAKVFEEMFTRMESSGQQGGFLDGADDEIDALFD
jgi:predicted regulator of Ras-like GTPase activity (Roadblock/LC7/MglB family)